MHLFGACLNLLLWIAHKLAYLAIMKPNGCSSVPRLETQHILYALSQGVCYVEVAAGGRLPAGGAWLRAAAPVSLHAPEPGQHHLVDCNSAAARTQVQDLKTFHG